MSARKAARTSKRGDKTKRTRKRRALPTATEVEDARLALLGVYAVCELVQASYAASRRLQIVLTRGALQPLQEALELLGQRDTQRLWWPAGCDPARNADCG